MARDKVDRSLIRSYPELRDLIEEKEVEDFLSPSEDTTGFSSLDDPDDPPPVRDALDDPS
jgi:hypothetical protein